MPDVSPRPARIAGTEIVPFLTEGYEGFDVNDPTDWWYAEHLSRAARRRFRR